MGSRHRSNTINCIHSHSHAHTIPIDTIHELVQQESSRRVLASNAKQLNTKRGPPRAPEKKSTISPPELRRFELVRGAGYTFPHHEKATSYKEAVGRTAADVQSAINRALHRESVYATRVEGLRVAQKGQLFSITNTTTTEEALLIADQYAGTERKEEAG